MLLGNLLLLSLIASSPPSQLQVESDSPSRLSHPIVYRPPFLLRLQIDQQRYYEEEFKPTPFVADGAVYLFVGDSFGVDVKTVGNQLIEVVYQPKIDKADVGFEFKQQPGPSGPVMVLVIRNTLKRTVLLDALMTVPGDKDIHQTDVLPVRPGGRNTESWPHPIVQLMLRNFRLSDATR